MRKKNSKEIEKKILNWFKKKKEKNFYKSRFFKRQYT